MSKLKKKASELKAWYRKNEAAILVAGTAFVGAAGWALAGYYQGRAIKAESVLKGMRVAPRLEEVGPDNWPLIEISPDCMKDVQEGATLKYREFRVRPNSVIAQFTTLDDFPPEADESIEEEMRNA